METIADVLRFLARHGAARNPAELAALEHVIADAFEPRRQTDQEPAADPAGAPATDPGGTS